MRPSEKNGRGSMFSIILEHSTESQVIDFIDQLKMYKISVSFGDTRSLVCYPIYMTHMYYRNHNLSTDYDFLDG